MKLLVHRRQLKEALIGTILPPIAGFALGLLMGVILILLIGADPILAYCSLFRGAFGGVQSFCEVLVKATPLIFTGLSITISFKAKYWNIGAEGQLVAGAIAATIVGLYLGEKPFPLPLIAEICAGVLAGGLWGLLPGVLRIKFRANEILTTIMMSFIALLLLSYLVHYPLRDPSAWLPVSPMLPESAILHVLVPKTRLHTGFVMALAAVILSYILLWYTALGFEIRAVGAGPEAARAKGISIGRIVLITSFISGSLAGLGGLCEISGIHYRLKEGISMGYGYTGILIALLGRLHPVGVVLVSILFSALVIGSESMQRFAGIPVWLTYVVQGLIVILAIAFESLVSRREGS